MNIAVVYCSVGGNTRKIAEIIANELGTLAQAVKDGPDVGGIDLLFAGSGCYGGKPGKEMVRFLEKLRGVKKAAVFGTYLGETKAIRAMEKILKDKGIEIMGMWGCNGSFLYLVNRGRPNAKDLDSAGEFANEVLRKAM